MTWTELNRFWLGCWFRRCRWRVWRIMVRWMAVCGSCICIYEYMACGGGGWSRLNGVALVYLQSWSIRTTTSTAIVAYRFSFRFVSTSIQTTHTQRRFILYVHIHVWHFICCASRVLSTCAVCAPQTPLRMYVFGSAGAYSLHVLIRSNVFKYFFGMRYSAAAARWLPRFHNRSHI